MRDNCAISVQNVSKKFRLFRSLTDRLLEVLPLRRPRRHAHFWALRDVSFDIPRGATVGILGRNGSGKSTLLQIIYSVLQPTSGTVVCHGELSALLELGAGFNPALTGRANLLLHGATHGLSQRETRERLPRIEAFADIGPFLDQPVKTYSSGMFVRLAFAAAISANPDILIVDEALAVGDAQFQQKCYQKFLDFQRAGKTVLLVTHDLQAVVKHCHHAFLLEHGRLIGQGAPKEVVNSYEELLFSGTVNGYRPVPERVWQGYKGFSIVHYRNKHYGLAESLGPVDLVQMSEDDLTRLEQQGKCAVGQSLYEVKVLVDRLARSTNGGRTQQGPDGAAGSQGERYAPRDLLEEFLEVDVQSDNCPRRPGYNKNEHRYGDRRGEILDYLLVCGEDKNAVIVLSGEVVDIYVKARFREAVERPMVGFALKTVDGVLVYGTNARMVNLHVPAAGAADVVMFKFSMRLRLAPGDFFIDLGLAEKLASEDRPLDRRYGVIHLRVYCQRAFTGGGLVDFEAQMQEVARIAGAA